MAVKLVGKYQKVGAVFNNVADAVNDKDSNYSSELLAETKECFRRMLDNGVMLSPTEITWDQENYTIRIERVVSSFKDYEDAITFSIPAVMQGAAAGGWVFLGNDLSDI